MMWASACCLGNLSRKPVSACASADTQMSCTQLLATPVLEKHPHFTTQKEILAGAKTAQSTVAGVVANSKHIHQWPA